MENDRDFWYHDLMMMPLDSKDCKTEVMDSEGSPFHPLHIRNNRVKT